MAIPKKIFQTYSSLAALHSDIRKNIEKIQENHPDWEYTFFSESDVTDFISDNYGDYFLEMYQRIDPGYGGTRADLFRYLLLFKVGGVYLDVKSGLVKNLNQIIKPEDTFLLSHWGPDYKGWGQYPELEGKPEFQNWFIISAPKHPFLGATIGDVIENIERYSVKRFGTGKIGGVRTTGPIPYSKVIYKLKSLYPCRIIDSEKEGIRYSIFEDEANKLKHVDVFKSHYSKLSKPIVSFEQKPLSELKKSTGQTQQKDDFSKPSRLYFRGFEFFVTKQRAPLTFICSHERSGTHFLINALEKNIGYASNNF